MDAYWLTPVTCLDPLTLGADRLNLQGGDAERLRRRLAAVHPRLLPFFKADLLLSGDSDDQCGSEANPFLLEDGRPVPFDHTLPLSHCAEAFFDRLPSAAEQLQQLSGVLSDPEWTPGEAKVLEIWESWLKKGWPAILLR